MQECMPEYLTLAQNTSFVGLGMCTFHIYEFLQAAMTECAFCPGFHSCGARVNRLNTSDGSK